MKIEFTSKMVFILEESARNHNIVLQKGSIRLRPECPWRARKNDSSWIISAVLKSSFCSSSCCKEYFPSIVSPMNRLRELVLKVFFYSPEMNRSILFSMYLLRMTKKMNQFLQNFVCRERIFPWFNINPIPSDRRNISWWRLSRFFSLWFCFCLSGPQYLSQSVVTFVLRPDLQELLCRCYSNPSQTHLIHEKLHPKSECYLCSERIF